MKTIIGVTGPIGSGKDTVADYIAKKLGIPVFEISKYIKDKIREAGLPINRTNTMNFGKQISKEEGPDSIAKLYLSQMGDMAVFSGFRQPPQLDYLEKNANLILIAVDADPKLRHDRVMARGTVEEFPQLDSFLAHEQEENSGDSPMRLFDCMARAKYKILNNSDLAALFHATDEVLKEAGFEPKTS
jgi:dephospho-CoA kinase